MDDTVLGPGSQKRNIHKNVSNMSTVTCFFLKLLPNYPPKGGYYEYLRSVIVQFELQIASTNLECIIWVHPILSISPVLL